MTYIYHLVPKRMEGVILYPLNTLGERYPEAYRYAAAKYEGREIIREQRIPTLDCLWNDVLHFTSVHPSQLKEALAEAGKNTSYDTEVFEVDPHLLDPNLTTVYLYKYKKVKGSISMKDNYAPYNPDDVALYSKIPEDTKSYYKENRSFMLFHGIPHILFKGSLDTTHLKKINW